MKKRHLLEPLPQADIEMMRETQKITFKRRHYLPEGRPRYDDHAEEGIQCVNTCVNTSVHTSVNSIQNTNTSTSTSTSISISTSTCTCTNSNQTQTQSTGGTV